MAVSEPPREIKGPIAGSDMDRVVWSLFAETFSEWIEARAPPLGAALAFYTVFALAPGLLAWKG